MSENELVATADGIEREKVETNKEGASLAKEMRGGVMLSPTDHLEITLWNTVHFAASLIHLFHHPDGTRPNPVMYEAANKIMTHVNQCTTLAYENATNRDRADIPE
jgi:hypothetical protein